MCLLALGCRNAQILAPALDFSSGGDQTTPTPITTEHGFIVIPDGSHQFFNDGQLWQYRGATAFALFQRYLDGENISGLLDVYKSGGVNTLRVLGMWGYQDFNPSRYGEAYWLGLPKFADELASRQIRLEFVVFADAQRILPQEAAQKAHAERVYATLAGKWNVFIELANEHEINGVDPSVFTRPTSLLGVLASAGSAGGGQVTGTNWDYGTFHGDRSDAWYQTFWYPNIHIPVVLDEPMGAAEFNQPGRRDNNPDHFYQFGKFVYEHNFAGATFHSENGLYALPLGPTEVECMRQLFRGMSGK